MVLYEMVTGRLPSAGEGAHPEISAVLHSEPQPPKASQNGLPQELWQVVAKALAKDPAERYQRITELIVDMKKVQK